MQVVLVEPQIPPNTGNIARLCAATRVPLHLVDPLGFEISDRHLRRAGLDYWEHVELHRHKSFEQLVSHRPRAQLYFFSTKAQQSYLDASFQSDAVLIFGNETEGLPGRLFEQYPGRFFTIPMSNPAVRSLNLSSAVAIVVYEALRQTGSI